MGGKTNIKKRPLTQSNLIYFVKIKKKYVYSHCHGKSLYGSFWEQLRGVVTDFLEGANQFHFSFNIKFSLIIFMIYLKEVEMMTAIQNL